MKKELLTIKTEHCPDYFFEKEDREAEIHRKEDIDE